MKTVPGRLLVLGGGAAGVELGQAAHRLGAQVTIVESSRGCYRARRRRSATRSPRPGGRRDRGDPRAHRHPRRARRRRLRADLDDGREVRGDRLLVATGRRPRVHDIGLETVGITLDPHGVPVDDRLRAGERLWAVGDITGIWQLTHVGEYQGEVVAQTFSAKPAAPTTRPSRGSPTPTPKPRASARPKPRTPRPRNYPRSPKPRPTPTPTPSLTGS